MKRNYWFLFLVVEILFLGCSEVSKDGNQEKTMKCKDDVSIDNNTIELMQLCYKFNLMEEHPLLLNIYLLDSAQIEFDRIESRIPEIKNDKDDFTFINITHYGTSTNNIIFHLDSLSKSKKNICSM